MASGGGPILVKISSAAALVRVVEVEGSFAVPSAHHQVIEGTKKTALHIVYDEKEGSVSLVFKDNGNWASLTRETFVNRLCPTWLESYEPRVEVHKPMLNMFDHFIGAGQANINSVMMGMTGGSLPRRIVCTGFSIGGALATLAAAWAGVTYPTSDTRCVTFASPRVGNSYFTSVFKRLVGPCYRVVYDQDPSPAWPAPVMLEHVDTSVFLDGKAARLIERTSPVHSVSDHDFNKYFAALEAAGGKIAAHGTARALPVPEDDDNDEAPKTRDITSRILQHSHSLDTYKGQEAELNSLEKLLLVSKISQAAVLAGEAYSSEEVFREKTGLTNTKLIDTPELDTQVHVCWLESGTAVFAFRGTESGKDQIQDIKFLRRTIPFMQHLFPGVKGHGGFLEQFESVMSTKLPEHHLGAVLQELSGGRQPTRVICAGHSLGGALATLGAAWAAIQYPNADVRCVTFGSPRVGSPKFVRAFHALVSCSHRMVHNWDPIPAVPIPFRFKHVSGGIFLSGGAALLRSRPWYYSYGWAKVTDHFCDKYFAAMHKVTGVEVYSTLGLTATPSGQLKPAQEVLAGADAKLNDASVAAAVATGAAAGTSLDTAAAAAVQVVETVMHQGEVVEPAAATAAAPKVEAPVSAEAVTIKLDAPAAAPTEASPVAAAQTAAEAAAPTPVPATA